MSETLPPWNAPSSFPLLGLTADAWLGPRRGALNAGTGIEGPSYRSHAYHLPGRRFPTVVIGVGVRPALPTPVSGDTALCWLLRAPERPAADEPATTVKEPVEVDDGIAVAEYARWPEPRLSFVRFDWRLDLRVGVASWDYPLSPAFFRSLVVC